MTTTQVDIFVFIISVLTLSFYLFFFVRGTVRQDAEENKWEEAMQELIRKAKERKEKQDDLSDNPNAEDDSHEMGI